MDHEEVQGEGEQDATGCEVDPKETRRRKEALEYRPRVCADAVRDVTDSIYIHSQRFFCIQLKRHT